MSDKGPSRMNAHLPGRYTGHLAHSAPRHTTLWLTANLC